MTFWEKCRDFVKFMSSANIFSYASQVAFYFMVALFPLLYVILKVTAFFSISSENILHMLEYIFPPEGYEIVYQELLSLSGSYTSWRFILICGVCIWSSTMLLTSIKNAIRIGKKEKNQRNFILNKIISLIITIILGVAVFVSILLAFALNITASVITNYLGFGFSSEILTLILAGTVFLIILVMIYMIAPIKRIKISQSLPGAIIAEFLFLSGSLVFSYYVSGIADYSITYGAFSGVIILLVWLYICSAILIFGGHINNYLRIKKEQKVSQKEENL